MGGIVIHVPDEIGAYEPELRFFFDNMVRKLHINRHKEFIETATLYELMDYLANEVNEVNEAIHNEGQFEAYMETVDVANQAWLLGLALLRMTKEEYSK